MGSDAGGFLRIAAAVVPRLIAAAFLAWTVADSELSRARGCAAGPDSRLVYAGVYLA
jgi:hypothetical protein